MPPDAPSIPRLALAIVIVATAAAVGVAVLAPGDAQSAGQPIGYNASERLAELDSFSATSVTVIERANGTNRTVRRVYVCLDTGAMRSEPVNGSTLIVSNGSVMWLYDRAENAVTRLDVSSYGQRGRFRGERIERLFRRLNVSRAAVDESERVTPSPRISPLPVVPSPSRQAATPVSATGFAEFGVRYRGTATVSGRRTYVLTIATPNGSEAGIFGNYSQTMYVDAEWFLPLKTRTAYTLDGERVEITTTYRNVSFNPDLPDSLFEFEPPANATVETFDTPEPTRYDSVAALRANVSISVPDPSLPPSFELERATSVSGNRTFVSLRYTNATAAVGVSKASLGENETGARGFNATDGEGERVTIDGQEGVYSRIGPTRLVSWSCDGFAYTVTGTGVSREMLIHVAESVGCR